MSTILHVLGHLSVHFLKDVRELVRKHEEATKPPSLGTYNGINYRSMSRIRGAGWEIISNSELEEMEELSGRGKRVYRGPTKI